MGCGKQGGGGGRAWGQAQQGGKDKVEQLVGQQLRDA